jgi:hypothetical protein
VKGVEKVPDIPMFRENTAAFIHETAAGTIANVDGDSGYVQGTASLPTGASQSMVVRGHGSPPISCVSKTGSLPSTGTLFSDEATQAESLAGFPMFGDRFPA